MQHSFQWVLIGALPDKHLSMPEMTSTLRQTSFSSHSLTDLMDLIYYSPEKEVSCRMEEWKFMNGDFIIYKANKDRIDLMLQKVRVVRIFLFGASVLI